MGKKRKRRKAAKQLTRAYEAAMAIPSRGHVQGANLSHDAAAERAYPRLTHWGRYLDENSDVVSGLLDEAVRGVVGRGIVTMPAPLLPDGEVDEELAEQITLRRRKWERRCDVTGELHYGQLLRLLARAWLRDGEVFMHHIAGAGSAYPFQAGETPYRIEFLESELVPWDLSDRTSTFAQEQGWRQGVRRDAWGRRLEYAVYRHHPGDVAFGFGGATVRVEDVKRVPAIRMTHLMCVKRWPATRGVSALHAAIPTVYDLKDMRESERIKNRILASWTAAVRRAPDLIGIESDPVVDEQGNPRPRGRGNRYMQMAAGTIIDELTAGEDIIGVGPDYPVTGIDDYINDELRRVSAATGVMHSAVARRYDKAYSAARQEMVVQNGLYEMRTDDFVHKVCRPLHERFILAEIMSGELRLPRRMSIEDAANADYLSPVTPPIDPLKQSQADKLDVDEGFVPLEVIQVKRGTPQGLVGRAPTGRQALPEPAPDDDDEGAQAA